MAAALCGLMLAAGLRAGESAETAMTRDAQHDFDFEFGTWHAKVRRLTQPLSGSATWVEYEGPSIVRPVWGGRANLGEIDLTGPAGKIRGLSLRLYDPESHQWRISWANAGDGLLGTPMVGGFTGDRGEFYNQETYQGRSVFVRFIFSGMGAKSTFRIEQAFSPDGGKTWETNWIANFTREEGARGGDKPAR